MVSVDAHHVFWSKYDTYRGSGVRGLGFKSKRSKGKRKKRSEGGEEEMVKMRVKVLLSEHSPPAAFSYQN